jgi:hypothetical protein
MRDHTGGLSLTPPCRSLVRPVAVAALTTAWNPPGALSVLSACLRSRRSILRR